MATSTVCDMGPYVVRQLRRAAATEPGASPDQLIGHVERLIALLAQPAEIVADGTRIDRIATLERLRSAAAAAQYVEMVAFARSQVEAQRGADVDPRQLGRGIADQIALACGISPAEGSRRLTVARGLVIDLPHTLRLLTAGQIDDRAAQLVAGATDHLDRASRQHLDADLVDELPSLSAQRAAGAARRLAYAIDPVAAVERSRRERSQRRVTLRPAPDTMSLLSACLPVEQGVACWAALHRSADELVGRGDGRSRGQIMADTLVERVTGQAKANDIGLDVSIMIGVDALLDHENSRSAEICGFGPIPAAVARELIATSRGRSLWRRLFTAPIRGSSRSEDGGEPEQIIVGGDRHRRRFDGWLAEFIRLRDRHCRDPFCDAPIRHLDHVRPFRDGGLTTAQNGRAVCARGNYVREMPGWRVDLAAAQDRGAIPSQIEGRRHEVVITTPTGHRYASAAPQPP